MSVKTNPRRASGAARPSKADRRPAQPESANTASAGLFAVPFGGRPYGSDHVAVFAGRYCGEHGMRH